MTAERHTDAVHGARKVLIAAVSCAMLVALGVVVLRARADRSQVPNGPEPHYKGIPLKQWVKDLNGEFSVQQVEALTSMGTNAVPFLSAWMRYSAPGWKPALYSAGNSVCAVLKRPRKYYDQQEFLADDAAAALWILQEHAPTLWSECSNLTRNPKVPKKVRARANHLLFLRAGREHVVPGLKQPGSTSTNFSR